jgi:hypothetical protein
MAAVTAINLKTTLSMEENPPNCLGQWDHSILLLRSTDTPLLPSQTSPKEFFKSTTSPLRYNDRLFIAIISLTGISAQSFLQNSYHLLVICHNLNCFNPSYYQLLNNSPPTGFVSTSAIS